VEDIAYEKVSFVDVTKKLIVLSSNFHVIIEEFDLAYQDLGKRCVVVRMVQDWRSNAWS